MITLDALINTLYHLFSSLSDHRQDTSPLKLALKRKKKWFVFGAFPGILQVKHTNSFSRQHTMSEETFFFLHT